jgi:hypothetical protein
LLTLELLVSLGGFGRSRRFLAGLWSDTRLHVAAVLLGGFLVAVRGLALVLRTRVLRRSPVGPAQADNDAARWRCARRKEGDVGST